MPKSPVLKEFKSNVAADVSQQTRIHIYQTQTRSLSEPVLDRDDRQHQKQDAVALVVIDAVVAVLSVLVEFLAVAWHTQCKLVLSCLNSKRCMPVTSNKQFVGGVDHCKQRLFNTLILAFQNPCKHPKQNVMGLPRTTSPHLLPQLQFDWNCGCYGIQSNTSTGSWPDSHIQQ